MENAADTDAKAVVVIAITPGEHLSVNTLSRKFIHSISIYRTPTVCQAIVIMIVKVPALIDFIF